MRDSTVVGVACLLVVAGAATVLSADRAPIAESAAVAAGPAKGRRRSPSRT